jgi:hypothetical protein
MDELFNLPEEASSFMKEKRANDDGLLRPKLEEGKDGRRELVIRFLPNLQKDGKIGPTAVEKHIHYADFKGMPELSGYFDCLKNPSIGKDCPLCKTYWKLAKSNNPQDQDKAKLINRSTKYYSYVYVVEDSQKPENEGKIMIFPFGFKIFAKIKAQAENKRKPCKVEDLIHGANLSLIIEEVGGFYNYDQSFFEAPEPITINGTPLKVEADGTISKTEKARVVEFLKSREHDLEDFMPQDWTQEQSDKVNKIISYLTTGAYDANNTAASDIQMSTPRAENRAPISTAAFFEEGEEDEETEVAKPAKKAAPKAETPAPKTSTKNDVDAAKRKAAAFFEDDDE